MGRRISILVVGFVLALVTLVLCLAGVEAVSLLAKLADKAGIGYERFLVLGTVFGCFWIGACLGIQHLDREAGAARLTPSPARIGVQPVREPYQLRKRYEFLRDECAVVARWAPDSRWRVYLAGDPCEMLQGAGQEPGFKTPEEAIDTALRVTEGRGTT